MRSELFVTFTAEPAHTLLPIQPESSPRRECRAERLAHMRTVQPGVVALLWAARRYLEIRKNRPRPRQQRADLLLEDGQVGEFMHRGIARRPREAAKVHPVATGDRMAAIRLVGAVWHTKWKRLGGAAAAIVTRLPRFMSRLPSPSSTMMRLSGRPSASPSACEEASPIAPWDR